MIFLDYLKDQFLAFYRVLQYLSSLMFLAVEMLNLEVVVEVFRKKAMLVIPLLITNWYRSQGLISAMSLFTPFMVATFLTISVSKESDMSYFLILKLESSTLYS